jgi:hypothetical protein
LPIILLRNNVDEGRGTVKDTYEQYLIIYGPGIIGAALALVSVQLPLVGRKWSLVFSALCQGLSMALYTQVNSTAGYVGLNALEYIMQTVRLLPLSSPFPSPSLLENITNIQNSISTQSSTPPHQSFSTPNTAAVSVVCFPAWVV